MRKTAEQLEADLESATTDLDKTRALNALAEHLLYRDFVRSEKLAAQARSLATPHADTGGPEWQTESADSLRILCCCSCYTAHAGLSTEYTDRALALYDKLTPHLGARAHVGRAYVLMSRAVALLATGERDAALRTFEESLATSRSAGDGSVEGRILNAFGNLYQREGDFRKAFELQQQALDAFRSVGDRLGEASALNNVALCQEEFGNLSVALECHEQSLNIHDELDNPHGRACSLHNIGIIHRALGRFDKALECFEESLTTRRAVGSLLDQSYALANLADLYALQKDYVKALEYAREQLRAEETVGDEAEISWGHLNVGYIQCRLGNLDEGIEHLLQCYALSRKMRLSLLLCSCLMHIGQLYAQDPATAERLPITRLAQHLGIEGAVGSAFWVYCLERALSIAQEQSFKVVQHEAHLALSELHKSLGNFEKALEHLEKHDALKEEIYSEDVHRRLSNLKTVFRADGDWREAEILRARSEELSAMNEQLTREIATRKKMEEQRRRLEQLAGQARKMRSLNVMAASVAHNFNNLLTGVLGNIEMALDKMESGTQTRRMVEQAQKAANRAAELSRMMLLYVGQGREMPKPIDLSSLVKETVEGYRPAGWENVALECSLPGGLMAVLGGNDQIRHVTRSLLTNAFEALGKSGGSIRVSTSAVECDRDFLLQTYLYEDQPEGPYVCLEVSDTGCGMDRATMNRLFDPFFSRKAPGRGLSLATVLGIVRGHRGAISVSTEAGKGSTFRVYLPALSFAAASTNGNSDNVTEGRKGQGLILLVDDEQLVRSVGTRILHRMGFRILTASSGLEAIEIFRSHRDEITCVLLDLSMMDFDGAKVFAELRKIRHDVPVIISSGYNRADVMTNFVGPDVPAGFLQKPYQAETLAAELRALLEARHAT
jgi:signal transduction histidine kinase/ActR/RegA family two-component response regulator